jgi:NAD(P)-dependent dehydrogenase (short-subunit alcohol dehydrogenase family)
MLAIDLSNKVAVVTGVTKGVGLGIATILAKAGCAISGCGRQETDHEEVKNFIRITQNEGVEVVYTKTDVTIDNDLNNLITKTIDAFGRIDFLISNAGMNFFKGTKDCTDEDFEKNINLNFRSHWKISQLCQPYLDKSDNGTIVIITSNHAYATIPGCFPYSSIKTALKGLVQSLAIEWGPNIRAVGIAPGFIQTDGNSKWFDSFPDPEKERERTNILHPTGRIGTPQEVGAFCAFLCSDYAKFLNGTTYLMDGGRSAILQDG